MNPKIRLEDVSKTFVVSGSAARRSAPHAFTALDGVNLEVPPGEFLTIVGPSGCGKSTLLDLLAGLTAPTTGQVLLDGLPVAGPALDRGVVFQQYALFPWRTVQSNVEFGLESKRVSTRERRDIARSYLELVGLTRFADRYPHHLSGGMKQRVAIARSLAYDPSLLMMDEPFAAVDAQTREILQSELLRIWRRTQKNIVFITHSIDEAIVLGQRVAVMTSQPGRIKRIVDIPEVLRRNAEQARSLPLYGEVRYHLASLLRDEVLGAQGVPIASDVPSRVELKRPQTARWGSLHG